MKSPSASTMSSSTPVRLAPRPPPSLALTPGMVIAGGRYRLGRYLARGGMAEVWAAQHEGLRSEVAIKFVDAALARDEATAPYALERFRFEAQISAKISAKTRHVVAVHDAGEESGVPYLVMELVNGRTLEDEIENRGSMSMSRVADILDQVADALAAAHALGIVHRDLKPSNLMLVDEPDGRLFVKVADFGVAKALRADLALDRPRETAHGELVGSPAFMSPEQIIGDTGIDGRSDLWSLGVVTYEALTGGPCFNGANVPELMMSIGKGIYRPPSQVREDLPRGIDAFFARVFAPRPEGRFATAHEYAAAFRALIAPPPRRRSPGLVLVAGAFLLVAVGVAFFALRHPASALTPQPAPPQSGALILPAPHDDQPPIVEPTTNATPTANDRSAPPVTTTPRVKSTVTAAPAPSSSPSTPTVTPSVTPPPPPPPPPATSAPPKKKIDPSEIQ